MGLENYNSFLKNDIENAIFRANKAINKFKELHWPNKLLDIGCGSGELLKIAEGHGINELHGIDGVEDALQSCKGINAIIHEVDLNKSGFPFRAESFDGITCLEVLEHLYSPQLIVNEIFRVLQKGSWAIISVPNPFNYATRLKVLGGGNISDPGTIGGHIKFFRSKDLYTICVAAGFSQIQVEGIAYPTAYKKYGQLTNLLLKLRPDLFATWLFMYCQKSL